MSRGQTWLYNWKLKINTENGTAIIFAKEGSKCPEAD
jgi:hypothetical protein